MSRHGSAPPGSRMRLAAVVCALVVGLGLLPALTAAADVGTPGRLDVQQVSLSGADAKDRGTSRTVAPGWTTEVSLRADRQMVGLTWSGAPAGAVEVRIPTGPTTWGPWQELASDPDEGPDTGGNGRNGVGPLYLGRSGTDQIQVRVRAGKLTDLRMDAMRWIAPTGKAATDLARQNPGLTPTGKAGGPTGPVIHPRSQWAPGGWHPEYSGCTKAPVAMSQLRFVVIHHTDGTNNYRASDVPGILAGIYRFHTGSRGWCDIAYNFLVDRFGGVWQGRSGAIDVPIMGGHAKGFNTDSMGVALLGQHQPGVSPPAVAPTAASLAAIRQLVTWKLSIHGLDPNATVRIRSNGSTRYAAGKIVNLPLIQGHIDSSMTDCPGSLVRSQMAALRAGVAADLARSASPATWAPATSGQAYFAQVWRNSQARAATNTQAAQATSQVTRSGRPLAAVVADVLVSPATDDRIGRTVRLYEAFTGRHADTSTLAGLIAKRDKGSSTAALATELGRTPEFASRYTAGDNSGFIGTVYRNLLGRAPSAAEVATATKALTAGTTRAAFVASASDSQEYRNRTAQLTRTVDIWFSLLQQAPDGASYNAWPARLGSGTAPSALVAALLPRAVWVRRS